MCGRGTLAVCGWRAGLISKCEVRVGLFSHQKKIFRNILFVRYRVLNVY